MTRIDDIRKEIAALYAEQSKIPIRSPVDWYQKINEEIWLLEGEMEGLPAFDGYFEVEEDEDTREVG